jgi:PAS domain S-box-containing protein
MTKRSWLILGFAVLAMLSAGSRSPGAAGPKTVLVFYSEDRVSPAMIIMEQAIRSTFHQGPGQTPIYAEYLDEQRISTDAYEHGLVDFLREKYKDLKIDLIIAVGAPALRMLIKHRESLYRGVPIVFAISQRRDSERLDLGTDITGVMAYFEWRPTLDLALSLHPDTRRVVVVAGDSEFDRLYVEDARQEFSNQERVEFTYLIGLPMEELRKQLAVQPDRTIVFYTAISRDGAGHYFTNPESVSLISTQSIAPIYGCWEMTLGQGIVGGRLLSVEAIGVRASEIGLRVLAGEKPNSIPVETLPSAPMFDWRELRRWGISEKSLPPGSIVRFRTPSVWDEYKWRIIAIISFTAFQAILIVGLLIQRGRRTHAEQELRESEERFRSMADTAPVLIWVAGVDKLCTYFNTQWLEFTGRTMEQELGEGWAQGIHPEDYRRCLDAYVSAFDAHQSFRMEYRLRRHDGQYRWIVDTGEPRLTPDGTFAGYIGSAIDITDRKQAEEALRQTQAELAHAARLMTTGELAATIAHEVNQPLTAMVANANAVRRMMGNGDPGSGEAREAMNDIVKDAHRASQVIARIRSLLKKGSHRTEPLAINRVVDEVVDIVRNDLVRKRVWLRMDLAGDLPLVEADRVEMQQVILNLIINAVEAMSGIEDQGRNLLISTARDKSGGVLVEVRDSGVGIAAENLEHIFDAFYTTRPEGMGMGLSICLTIIEAHGGRLWAQSNDDRGATLRFTLPGSTARAS